MLVLKKARNLAEIADAGMKCAFERKRERVLVVGQWPPERLMLKQRIHVVRHALFAVLNFSFVFEQANIGSKPVNSSTESDEECSTGVTF